MSHKKLVSFALTFTVLTALSACSPASAPTPTPAPLTFSIAGDGIATGDEIAMADLPLGNYTASWYTLEDAPGGYSKQAMQFVQANLAVFGITGPINSISFIELTDEKGASNGAVLVLWEEEGRLLTQGTLVCAVDDHSGSIALISPDNAELIGIDVQGHLVIGALTGYVDFENQRRTIGMYLGDGDDKTLFNFIQYDPPTGEIAWAEGLTDHPVMIGDFDLFVNSGIDLTTFFTPRESDWAPDAEFPGDEDVKEYLVHQFYYEPEFINGFSEISVGLTNIAGEVKQAIIGVSEDGQEQILAAQVQTFDGETYLLRVSEDNGHYAFINPEFRSDGAIQVNARTAGMIYGLLGNVTKIGIPQEAHSNLLDWVELAPAWDKDKPLEIIFVYTEEEIAELDSRFQGGISEKIIWQPNGLFGSLFLTAPDGHGVIFDLSIYSREPRYWRSIYFIDESKPESMSWSDFERGIREEGSWNISILAEILKKQGEVSGWDDLVREGLENISRTDTTGMFENYSSEYRFIYN